MNLKQDENRIVVLFNMYIEDCMYVKRNRETTVIGERQTFNTFCKLMPEVEVLNDITYEKLVSFFKKLETRERIVGRGKIKYGVTTSTTDTYRRRLSRFFDWLIDENYLSQNPMDRIKMQKPVYTKDETLKRKDVETIFTAIEMNYSNLLIKKRDKAMVATLLFLGLRRGELLGLNINDVDLERGQITVRGETSKSKTDRRMFMPDQLKSFLIDYIQERKGYNYKTPALWVSGNKDDGLTLHGLKHWVIRLREKSGIKFHLHQFRHTYAVNLHRNGADFLDIMKLMGHKTTRMTLRYLSSVECKDVYPRISDFRIEKMA